MDGLEENMKLILVALKILKVDKAPLLTVQRDARAASSSAKNLGKDNNVTECGSDSGGGGNEGRSEYWRYCCSGNRYIIIVLLKLWTL
jgi:hypothetical protein